MSPHLGEDWVGGKCLKEWFEFPIGLCNLPLTKMATWQYWSSRWSMSGEPPCYRHGKGSNDSLVGHLQVRWAMQKALDREPLGGSICQRNWLTAVCSINSKSPELFLFWQGEIANTKTLWKSHLLIRTPRWQKKYLDSNWRGREKTGNGFKGYLTWSIHNRKKMLMKLPLIAWRLGKNE